MNSFKNHVIEFARFTLADGVDEPTLVTAADALQTEFLSRQSGFIRRFEAHHECYPLIRQGCEQEALP